MYSVTYKFKCSECGFEKAESYESDLIINPMVKLPSGWSQLPQGYICDKHVITITDIVEETQISE